MAASSNGDVYVYDSIPRHFRVQVTQMVAATIGNSEAYTYGPQDNPGYEVIVLAMRREKGVHRLIEVSSRAKFELLEWLENERDIDLWIDGVEMTLRYIDYVVSKRDFSLFNPTAKPEQTIAEFNARALEAGVGYQFVSGEIVRIDSQFLHREAVLPVLHLLSAPIFKSANTEYRSAHEAFRKGELEDCIVDCGKAFESVLKIIGQKRSWPIKPNDPASRLIQAAVDAGFLAAYSQSALNHLKGLIESSTPTLRNKQGGHGAGPAGRQVPIHLAAYQLHQTAAVILYLAAQDASLP